MEEKYYWYFVAVTRNGFVDGGYESHGCATEYPPSI